jgi:DUF4097 and DUF4098 domain-containing protein YvlB
MAALMVFALAAIAGAQVTEEFHRTVPLSSTGRVSVDNINGNVTITGWERNEVQIDAIKSARDQQRLSEARIEVEIGGDSVRVKTKYPDHHTNNNPATVTYQLHVPRSARLDGINLVNGSLEVSGVSGEVDASLVNGSANLHGLASKLDLSSVNGKISASFNSIQNASSIHLKTVNGSLRLGLPSSPNADVSVSTMNGGITTDFPLQVEGKFIGKHIDGKLGSGGTHIEISSVNGSVHIAPGEGNL